MLNTLRERHSKKTLWILTIVIIFAFGLGSGLSLIKNSQKTTFGTFYDKKITTIDFVHYLKMAKVYLALHATEEVKITSQDIKNLAIDFFVLSDKAQRDKIEASDTEIVDYIVRKLFPTKKFDKELYENFLHYLSRKYNLHMNSRKFEEYIRLFIKTDKVFSKYVKVSVSHDEARKIYTTDNQEAQIAYLFIPYTKFEVKANITQEEVKDFYQSNKALFKEEPKANILYAIIDSSDESITKKLAKIVEIKSLQELKEKIPLEIKETGFIGIGDPIKGVGWEPKINKIAFALKTGKVSPFIELKTGLLIIEKKGQRAAFTPSLDQIHDEVKEKLVAKNAKDATTKYAEALLKNISKTNISNLQKISKQEKIALKETDYFKYYDYIEGLGIDQKASEIIFSLKKNEIYPKALLRDNGAYVIQLKEITVIDEEKFQEKAQFYQKVLKQYKESLERGRFLEELKSKGNLQIHTTL